MVKQSLTVMMMAGLLLAPSGSGAASEPASSTNAFQQKCLSGQEKCIYARIRFMSAHSVLKQVRIYQKLANQSDIGAYDEFVNDMLTPGKVHGVKNFSVKRFNEETHAWVALPLTKTCQYCVSVERIRKQGSEWLQVDFVQALSPDSNSFIAVGDVVRRGEGLKIRIIVTAPHYVNSKDQSPIYIDSRIMGHHATTSFIEGGITIDLDGSEVPWDFPDYVAISPVASWAEVASIYRRRETALVKSSTGLSGSTDGTPEQRLDRVAHQLQAYRIHYDAYMGGIFPSLSPDQVIGSRHADCKALATLADALLRRVGIPAHVVVLSQTALPPLSFNVPGAFWNPLHAILYLPSLDLYIDPARITSFGANWKTSAEAYRGAIALDMTTGHFVVIH